MPAPCYPGKKGGKYVISYKRFFPIDALWKREHNKNQDAFGWTGQKHLERKFYFCGGTCFHRRNFTGTSMYRSSLSTGCNTIATRWSGSRVSIENTATRRKNSLQGGNFLLGLYLFPCWASINSSTRSSGKVQFLPWTKK